MAVSSPPDTIRDTMVKDLATRVADLKRRRRSVAPHDMDRLLVDAGFTRRQGKGDHWVYTHPQRPFPLTIDPRNPLLPAYVSKPSPRSRRWPVMDAEDYLALPYAIELVPDTDEVGRRGWVAEIEELPGCISQGATPEEAIANVRDAMLGWISIAIEDGREVPQPRALGTYSGKFIVRVPSSLHADLVRTAAREGVSLNQFVATTLARHLGRADAKAS